MYSSSVNPDYKIRLIEITPNSTHAFALLNPVYHLHFSSTVTFTLMTEYYLLFMFKTNSDYFEIFYSVS